MNEDQLCQVITVDELCSTLGGVLGRLVNARSLLHAAKLQLESIGPPIMAAARMRFRAEVSFTAKDYLKKKLERKTGFSAADVDRMFREFESLAEDNGDRGSIVDQLKLLLPGFASFSRLRRAFGV